MKLVLPRLPAQSRPKQLTRESYNVNIIYNMQIAFNGFPMSILYIICRLLLMAFLRTKVLA